MKGKWCNFCYLVPGCVISMFKFIFLNRTKLVWLALEKLHCTLALEARWCDQALIFRHTAKNLVAYATSWSLTLSPGLHWFSSGSSILVEIKLEGWEQNQRTGKPLERQEPTTNSTYIQDNLVLSTELTM